MGREFIINPHLKGDSFFWEGGEVGIVLIHGFTATTAEVRPLAEVLHNNGYTVAGPLLPGHYTEPNDLNKVHWSDWVSTVDGMYQAILKRCSKVFVGGESTGGLLALYLASNHPEVLGVLTYAPALRLTLKPLMYLFLNVFAPFVSYINKQNKHVDDKWQGYPVYPLKGTKQLINFQREVEPRLQNISQPVLIVQGRHDPTVHPDVPETIYNSVSSSIKELHWMEQSAHCVILDQEFDEVANISLAFIHHVLSQNTNASLTKIPSS